MLKWVLKSFSWKLFFSPISGFKWSAKPYQVIWGHRAWLICTCISTVYKWIILSPYFLNYRYCRPSLLSLIFSVARPCPSFWRLDTNLLRVKEFPFSHSRDAVSLAQMSGNTLCSISSIAKCFLKCSLCGLSNVVVCAYLTLFFFSPWITAVIYVTCPWESRCGAAFKHILFCHQKG